MINQMYILSHKLHPDHCDIQPLAHVHVLSDIQDGLGDTVKPRLIEADADLERVLVIDDRDTPLTLADERIARG